MTTHGYEHAPPLLAHSRVDSLVVIIITSSHPPLVAALLLLLSTSTYYSYFPEQ